MNLDEVLSPSSSGDSDSPLDRQKMLKAVEEELALFDQFMMAPESEGGCGQDPLVPMEKALLRTYLVARMSGRFPSTLEG
jgi:hypothetical protein